MRTIKLLLTALFAALAVVAGLVVTMLAALVSILILAARRWRHRGDPRPSPSAPVRGETDAGYPRARNAEVIDVVATEVPADPSHR